nr:hypothetical protein [Patescibacteria group bacterium]
MKKVYKFLPVILLASFLFAKNTLAVCPICTIAVGAGVGFSRYLGIDDVVSGLWVGGLLASMVSWTESWLTKKKINFKGRLIVDILFYYLIVIIPLYYSGMIGNPNNTIGSYGIDKLLFGIIVGSISFWFGASWYFQIKRNNGGHAYFPFQKVVMPISPLIILSILY